MPKGQAPYPKSDMGRSMDTNESFQRTRTRSNGDRVGTREISTPATTDKATGYGIPRQHLIMSQPIDSANHRIGSPRGKSHDNLVTPGKWKTGSMKDCK